MLNRSMAMNIRLKITFRFLTNGIFLYEGYQNDLLLYFRKFFNTEYLTVSDFLSSKKIETGNGIWLINKANLIICSPFLYSFMKKIINLPGKQLNIQENIFAIDNVKICQQKILNKGILLSGVFAHNNGNYLEYERSPELFSEYLRQNLIEIYKNINNCMEPDDRRFFISLESHKKQYILGKPMYKGIYEIFGSPELCSIFTQYFVTGQLQDKNTEKEFQSSERW